MWKKNLMTLPKVILTGKSRSMISIKKFHPTVEEAIANSERRTGERILGTDPKTGRQVSVRIGRFGPMVQIGTKEEEDKPQFASLTKGLMIDTITLEDALELFKLPRSLGEFEEKEMVAAIGRFGSLCAS